METPDFFVASLTRLLIYVFAPVSKHDHHGRASDLNRLVGEYIYVVRLQTEL
jgi:hypothetical protein